jgi:hypothetical protein
MTAPQPIPIVKISIPQCIVHIDPAARELSGTSAKMAVWARYFATAGKGTEVFARDEVLEQGATFVYMEQGKVSSSSVGALMTTGVLHGGPPCPAGTQLGGACLCAGRRAPSPGSVLSVHAASVSAAAGHPVLPSMVGACLCLLGAPPARRPRPRRHLPRLVQKLKPQPRRGRPGGAGRAGGAGRVRLHPLARKCA